MKLEFFLSTKVSNRRYKSRIIIHHERCVYLCFSDFAEENRCPNYGSFNGSRGIHGRDTDSRSSRIRSNYRLPDTSKTGLRTEPMGLSEAHHGATYGTLIVNNGTRRTHKHPLSNRRVRRTADSEIFFPLLVNMSVNSYQLHDAT